MSAGQQLAQPRVACTSRVCTSSECLHAQSPIYEDTYKAVNIYLNMFANRSVCVIEQLDFYECLHAQSSIYEDTQQCIQSSLYLIVYMCARSSIRGVLARLEQYYMRTHIQLYIESSLYIVEYMCAQCVLRARLEQYYIRTHVWQYICRSAYVQAVSSSVFMISITISIFFYLFPKSILHTIYLYMYYIIYIYVSIYYTYLLHFIYLFYLSIIYKYIISYA